MSPDLTYGASRIRETALGHQITYTPVTHREQKRGACPQCGKKNTRSRTWEATVSPFNKDPETGEPRTYSQVAETLQAKAAKWEPDFTCSSHFETEEDIPLAWPADPERSALVVRGLRLLADFAEGHGLPLHSGAGAVHLASPGSLNIDGTPVAHWIEVPVGGAHDLAAWAQALGCDQVRVDTWRDRPDTTRLRFRSRLLDGFEFYVRADYGRRLGAKDPVEWETDYRGKRDTWGHMTVGAVAALPERKRVAR